MLGYGFPAESLAAGLARRPHVIGADAGSTDGGPHKLGMGVGIVSRVATKKDLGAMLRGGLALGAPVVVGSAGGSGAEVHLRWTREIREELVREERYRVRVAYVHAELDKELLKAELAAGHIGPMRNVPPLSDKAIDSATRIVAQMGADPSSPGDAMWGVLRHDGFVVEPLNPARRCTPTSVAAHTLYEKSHPYLLPGPGGTTDLSACTFTPVDDRAG